MTTVIAEREFEKLGELIAEPPCEGTESVGELTTIVWAGLDDPTSGQWMRLGETSGAYDAWDDPREDIYSESDGEPV